MLTGVGGWSGAVVSGGLDTDIPYGALGFVNAVTDLPDHTAEGGTLLVFELPDAVSQKMSARSTGADKSASNAAEPQQ